MRTGRSVLGNIFFFKQKTAYEIRPSLVGSEMCIRDRRRALPFFDIPGDVLQHHDGIVHHKACLLYTSDAADDLPRVDLGGRRILKKKPSAAGRTWSHRGDSNNTEIAPKTSAC